MKLRQIIVQQNDSFGQFLEDTRFRHTTNVEDASEKLWLTEAAIMKVIKEFQGIITAVVLDREISNSEIDLLYQWRDYRSSFLVRYPLTQFNFILDSVSDESRYGENFKKELFSFIDKFALHFDRKRIEGIYDYPEALPFESMNFVLTGKFQSGEKRDFASRITDRGGIVAERVNDSTHYLIVGSEGNHNYSFGSFGSKIKKALEMRDRYVPIMIIEEEHFLRMIS